VPELNDGATDPESRTGPGSGIVGALGLDHWIEGDESHGRAAITPGLWVPGTQVGRIGALTLLADVIAGQPPSGPITPTTDINMHLIHLRPMESVHLVSRVLKAGRLLVVCATRLMADDETAPFALSRSTFMNNSPPVTDRPSLAAGIPSGEPVVEPLAQRIGARVVAPGVVELAPHEDVHNHLHGTILGGVIAMLAELAAESALGGDGPVGGDAPVVVTDLDVRFLNRVKVGPAVATARVLVSGPHGSDLEVEIRDVGDGERMIGYAVARGSRVPPLG
jgi:acyl-coenzyme A thioesterase PaaI-like protein